MRDKLKAIYLQGVECSRNHGYLSASLCSALSYSEARLQTLGLYDNHMDFFSLSQLASCMQRFSKDLSIIWKDQNINSSTWIIKVTMLLSKVRDNWLQNPSNVHTNSKQLFSTLVSFPVTL
jgi:hypothetical protein